MALYDITCTADLADETQLTCYGTVELSDQQYRKLELAIEQAQSTYIGVLDLDREIYIKLRKACQQAAYEAVNAYYLRNLYYDEEIDFDLDEVLERCKEDNLYFGDVWFDVQRYDRNPNASSQDNSVNEQIYFEEWLDDHIDRLKGRELIEFMSEYMDVNKSYEDEWEFTTEVPDALKA